MGGEELDFVREAFASNFIAPVGPQVDAFDREFAEAVGAKYAAAVSSGTAALHLVLRYVGVAAGDNVICSTFTFVASANSILYQNARPVFIDSDKESWNMNPSLLADYLEMCSKTGRLPTAVILVHLYGQSADIDPIKELCEKYKVFLIEDAAEALGALYKGKAAGTFGLAGVYSFNGNKIITTSGGGMVVSDDESLINKVRFWATQSRDPAPHYEHSELGYNYRMSNVLSAIGRGQLRVLDDRVNMKREIFMFYQDRLAALPGIRFMPEAPYGQSTRWLTCMTINPDEFGVDRETVRVALEEENIESRPVWKPLHLQPLFNGCEIHGGKVSEDLFKKGLCLPSGTEMTEEDLNRIVGIIIGLQR